MRLKILALILGAAGVAFGASVILSPNMGMPVPVVGTDPGPDWANNINASLAIVDQHDHSPGHGVPVTPAGLNISSDLSFGGNNATALRSTRFSPQGSPIAGGLDLGAVYESGVDLYYNDGNGNQIRMTQGGAVSGSAGTITGLPSGTASASYSGGTFTFQRATSTPATLSAGPITVLRNAASPFGVTLAASGSQGANYNLTLPTALPSQASVVTLDNTGQLGATLAPALAGATIVGGTISSATISGGTGAFSTVTIGALGSVLKSETFTGSNSASTKTVLIIPTLVYGFIGTTTCGGAAGNLLSIGGGVLPATAANQCNYVYVESGTVKIENRDTTHANTYNVTVFYN